MYCWLLLSESYGVNSSDLWQAGYIVDDEMNRLLVNPLPRGVRLHAIIDACHSGSVLDLEFKCKVKDAGVTWKNEYSRQPSTYKVCHPPVAAASSAPLMAALLQTTFLQCCRCHASPLLVIHPHIRSARVVSRSNAAHGHGARMSSLA